MKKNSKVKKISKTKPQADGRPSQHFIDIWEYVSIYRKHNYTSPSMDKIRMAGFGASKSVISYYLKKMIALGMITKIQGQYLGIIPEPVEKWKVVIK